jgi:hypothetical protein
LGAPEVTKFLTSLGVDGQVAASTQNQALSTLLFLDREVLEVDLLWAGRHRAREAARAVPRRAHAGASLLDGHNNPGFSGGPVVFKAVEQPIFQGDEETALTYRYNTGIIVAHDIKAAMTIIQGNPVGFQL